MKNTGRRLLSLALALVACAVFITPMGCYLSRGAWEEAKILSRRRPIPAMITDPATDTLTRQKLRIVLEARAYAKSKLRLRTKDSFTTFSHLDSDTLVLVLSAAYRDSLKAYTWWFPVVGRVPYKGYFDFAAAKRDQERFQRQGFDTYLRSSDAFSTLGWFNDPLLNTTLRRDSLDLVDTVIHEVTHNTFFAPGQVYFNESFANFVGARGAIEFFMARGQPGAAAEVGARWHDEKLLSAYWASLIGSLDSAFSANGASRVARLEARDSVYARARADLVQRVSKELKTVSPGWATRVPLNNAALLARRIYAQDLAVFDEVWIREGRDLRRAIARIVSIARANPTDPTSALKAWARAKPPASGAEPPSK